MSQTREHIKITHPLFLAIRTEHKQLEIKLAEIKFTENFDSLIVWFWNFIELNHHKKEEIILFKFLSQNLRLCEGGPLCSLYFDYHLSDPPTQRAKKITGAEIQFEPDQMHLMQSGSPLKIPLAEHQAGKEIIRYLLNKKSQLTQSEIKIALHEYEKIQLEHIAKEESCFFHLCANLLTQAEADQLLAQWNFI